MEIVRHTETYYVYLLYARYADVALQSRQR